MKEVELMNKEIRLAEIRAAEEGQVVEGYALVFEQETVLFEIDGIQYKEIIDRNALDGADLTDIPFKYNHSDNIMVMARTRNHTLSVAPDEHGLFIRAELANTTTGKDMYELIRRGDIDKMSFAFTVKEDSYDNQTRTRRIMKIQKLYDVSAVDLPAYDQTSISARSYFTAKAEEEEKAKQALNEMRQRLILQTYL